MSRLDFNKYGRKDIHAVSSQQFHMLKTSTPIFFDSRSQASSSDMSPHMLQKSQTFNSKACNQYDNKKIICIAKKSKPPAPQKIRLLKHGDEEMMRYEKKYSPIPTYDEFINESPEIAKSKCINFNTSPPEIPILNQQQLAIQSAYSREIIRRKPNMFVQSCAVIEELQSQIKSIQENNISIKNDLNLLLNNLSTFFEQMQKMRHFDKDPKKIYRTHGNKKSYQVRSSSLSDITVDNFESRLTKPKYTIHGTRQKLKKPTVRSPAHSPVQQYNRYCSNPINQRMPQPPPPQLLLTQPPLPPTSVDQARFLKQQKRYSLYSEHRTSKLYDTNENTYKEVIPESVIHHRSQRGSYPYTVSRSQVINNQCFVKNPRSHSRKQINIYKKFEE